MPRSSLSVGALAAGVCIFLVSAAERASAFGVSETGHRGITRSALGATQRVVDGSNYKFTDDAIAEIIKANVDTDLDQFTAAKHFDDESFQAGTQRLNDLEKAVVDNLKGKTPDGAKARADLGTALHAVQDFYAHTNWVELGRVAIENRLGREVFGGLAANVATCPNNSTTLGGDGLTSLTSGYFLLRSLCTPPAGKCRHGADLPFNRCPTGIHKDEPGRPNYQAAYDFAVDASKDFLNQILDADGVAGKARAIQALMDTKPMLGVIIDGTGSMGDKLAAVQAQVERIVNDLRGTANEPLRYLLVRFGDPDIGGAFVTVDADSFLNRVRGLGATGGGDCPEPSMVALLTAVVASYADAKLYLFTDAPPKDPEFTDLLIDLAQIRRTSINPVLLGTCPHPEPAPDPQQSEAVDLSNVDPAYVDLAFETGGALDFLNASDTQDLLHLVEPDLCGNLQHLLLAEGSMGGAGHSFDVSVDGTMQSLTVTAYVDSAPSVVLHRPGGAAVGPTDPDVTITDLATGRVFTMTSPEAGDWQLDLSGHGRFLADAEGCSPVQLARFDFEAIAGRPGHQGLFPIPCQPLAGVGQTAVAELFGPAEDASFELVDEAGLTLQSLSLSQGNPGAGAGDFVGSLSLPSQPFRAAVTGTVGGQAFRRVFPELFRAQTVEISVADSIGMLNAGTTTSLTFGVHNVGAGATFRVMASDDQGFVSPDPHYLTLGSGATGTVDVQVSVPQSVPDGAEVKVTVAVTSTSAAETNNCASRTLAVQTPIPVLVEDLAAVPVPGGVRLSWRLAAAGAYDLAGVSVQRAESPEGPFATRTATPLAPEPSMFFVDASVESRLAYWYRLMLVGRDGHETYSSPIGALSRADSSCRTELEIAGATSTSGPIEIRYGVARSGTHVRLSVFDVAGRRLRVVDEGVRARGEYLRHWDRVDESGARAARGVYLVQLTAGDVRISRKLLLLAP